MGECELAAKAVSFAEVAHGAHGEPEGSMPERNLLELSALAMIRVETPRHQARIGSEKCSEPN